MTNEILYVDAVAGFLFSNSTDYNATDLGDLENTDTAPTAVQLDLTSLGAGAAREATKMTFPLARAMEWLITMSVEYVSAPAAGDTVDLYWGTSHSGTPGKGNMGQLTGTDAAYAGGAQTLAEALKKLTFLGSLILSEDIQPFVHTGVVRVFSPPDRYGTLVVHNNSADIMHSDMNETAISFEPIVTRIADAP